MSSNQTNVFKSWWGKIRKSQAYNDVVSLMIAVGAGLVFGFIILLVSNPSDAIGGFLTVLAGGFSGGSQGIGDIFYYATPILLTGLSVGFAFKTGLFNIGAAGQYMIAQYATIYVIFAWTWIPSGMQWMVGLLVALIVGGIWGAIPGLFKAYLNVNEVITSIMFNYIGLYLVNFMIKSGPAFDLVKSETKPLPASSNIPKLGLNQIFSGSSVNGGIVIAIIAAIVIYIILNKTTFGYELKACGFNRHASKYAGINDKRNILLSMAIAGALAGLGGGLAILAGSGNKMATGETLDPNGFKGIPVALLGLSNPIGIIFSALFISYIERGGYYMQMYEFVPEVIDIMVAMIIYLSAFSLMFRLMIERWNTKKRARLVEEAQEEVEA